jgi:hypothetical protein
MFGPSLLLMLVSSGQAPEPIDVRMLAGDPAAGHLQSVAAGGSVKVGDRTVAAGEWYSLRRTGGVLPAWPRAPHVELTTGDRIVGTAAEADGDALRLRLPSDQTVRLPLSSIRAVWLTTRPAGEPDPDWLAGARKRDVFLARNGDTAFGALTEIDAAHNAVRFQADGKGHQLEFAKLAAIAFNTDLARVRRPKGPYYRLTLADGSRLSTVSVAFDRKSWTVITPFKETIRFPADQVVSVDVEQGKVTYLSDLKPTKYDYRPYDGEQYPWVADRCVTGRAMTLKTANGESTFDRGIGLHSECTISYSLAGKYHRFEMLVGLDANSGLRGEVDVMVLVDGKEQPLAGGGHLTLAGGVIPVRVDMTGVKELTIAVRRGGGGNVQDHVDLAEARLAP